MNCPSCEFENPKGMKFCGKCGNALAPTCPDCGAENPAEFSFCGQCGASMKAEDTPDRGTPKVYTPKHLADKVLSQRSALEGEKKQVTIMFADVKGSMELADEVGPEEWHSILDRFFELLSEGVHRFEGTVNQYTGDGIMALFGAPIAHEDHARRACYAALHLQKTLSEYAREQRRTRGLNFAVRIGINSGEVIVGKIGDDLRMDYTAQGLTVGLAQRMEQLAEPGRVYLTDHAAKNVQGFFELEDMGEFKVKGVSGPMHVFDLQGLGRLRTRLELSQARGFSTFVGRKDEMRSLEVALKHSQDGRGQVAGVVGEAGVGKSRLCYEFLQKCREQGVPVYESHCPAHGQTIPYLPILELFRNYFGVLERDTAEEARRKIAGTLVLLDSSLNEALPLMFDFLGVADPNQPELDLSPDARSRQLIDFTRRMTKLRGEQEPAIIYIDDLHWIDPGSDAFLGQFIETLDQTHTVLLLNFRPEYQPQWNHKPYYQQLPIVPLSPEAISELVHELLGNDDTLENLSELVEKRTGGNPFFIEEVIQTLVEAGNLEGTRGGYRLTIPVESLQIPNTVKAILAARIDRLSQDSKHVLQTAAVIGKEFIEPVLREVVEVAVAELSTALNSLQAAEFIYEQAIYPVEEYTFKHPLTQEVALDTQLQERKKHVHAAVAQAIMGAAPEKHEENAALIAYHLEAAEHWAEAMAWHERAAEWVGTSDPVGAARHWRKIIDLGSIAIKSETTNQLLLKGYSVVQSMGAWRMGMTIEELSGIHDKGVHLANQLGDDRARIILEVQWAGYQSLLGKPDLFRELAANLQDEVLSLDPEEDVETYVNVPLYLAFGFFIAGDLEEAENYYGKALTAAKGDVTIGLKTIGYSVVLQAQGLLGCMYVKYGKIAQGKRDIQASHSIMIEKGYSEMQCWAPGWLIEAAFIRGVKKDELVELERLALESSEISEQIGSLNTIMYCRNQMAQVHIMNERWEEAKVWAERALEIHQYNTGFEAEAQCRTVLGLAQIGLRQLDDAEENLKIIVEKAKVNGSTPLSALGCITLAKAILASPKASERVAEIEDALDVAASIIEQRGEISFAPQLTECRARVAGLVGDDIKEVALFNEAIQGYQSVGATGHRDRLAAEVALS